MTEYYNISTIDPRYFVTTIIGSAEFEDYEDSIAFAVKCWLRGDKGVVWTREFIGLDKYGDTQIFDEDLLEFA